MMSLGLETIIRKSEIAFFHPAGALVLPVIWLLVTYNAGTSVENLFDALSTRDKLVTVLYAVFVGVFASFIGLGHGMFRWVIFEHFILQVIFVLTLSPSFLVLIRGAICAHIKFGQAVVAIPLTCVVVYYIFALVFIFSPLTAVE